MGCDVGIVCTYSYALAGVLWVSLSCVRNIKFEIGRHILYVLFPWLAGGSSLLHQQVAVSTACCIKTNNHIYWFQ